MTDKELFINAVLASKPIKLCDTERLLRYVFFDSWRSRRNGNWEITENTTQKVEHCAEYFPGIIPSLPERDILEKHFQNTKVNDLIDY